MATKIIELALMLKVAGTPQAEAMEKAIASIKTQMQLLAGAKQLDKILNALEAGRQTQELAKSIALIRQQLAALGFKKTLVDFDPTVASAGRLGGQIKQVRTEVDLLVTKGKQLVDIYTKAGGTKVNIDLSKLKADVDLVMTKGKQMIDLLTVRGKTKVDFDFSKLKADIDLVVSKGRQMVDLFTKGGKTPVDFNLGKIEEQAQRAAIALRNLSAQKDRTNAGFAEMNRRVQDAHRSFLGFGREILLFRRLLFGLGITGATTAMLNLVQSFDKAKQSLSAVFGGGAGEEFDFIREQAERLGLSITDLSDTYSKFSIASRSLGLSQAETRDVFLAVAEAGSRLALSSEQVNGALTALQQIASKGRLSMEELRQQLGDRLPGAISIAAKAIGVTEARLFALVEQGLVTSDVFLKKFPAALRATFNTDSNTRIETTTAKIQRFQNALSELIDAALRSGILDAFTDVLKNLTEVFKDKETLANLKALSSGIGSFFKLIAENGHILVTLIGTFAGFKILGLVAALFGKVSGAFIALAGAGGQAAAGAIAVATGLASATTKTGPLLTGLKSLIARFGSLAATLASPWAVVLAGGTAIAVIAIQTLAKIAQEAEERTRAFAEATRELGRTQRVTAVLEDQVKVLSEYADTVALGKEELKSLSVDGLRYYNTAAEGAKKLTEAQVKQYANSIDGAKQELKLLELSGSTTDASIKRKSELVAIINDLTKAQEEATGKGKEFAETLALITTRAEREGITLTADHERLTRLAQAFDTLNLSAVPVTKLTFKGLSESAQTLVAGFREANKSKTDLDAALEKAIPKNFAQGAIEAITDVGNGFAFIAQEGDVAAEVITKKLAKALDSLTGADLQAFAVNVGAAFDQMGGDAAQFNLLMDVQLRATLKNLGVEATDFGDKVSGAFNEVLQNFQNVAENTRATGKQIKDSLDKAFDSAKSREELLALQATIEQTGLRGGQFAKQLEDSFTRLSDKIRLMTGVMDSALGDSFERLGIQSKVQLKALADQAKIDFDRIMASGQASAIEIEAAFVKMAEIVTKANQGIPPIEIIIKAVNMNQFDLIVKAAETASQKVRKHIEKAIPLVETVAQAKALGESIRVAFEIGSLAAADFGELMTNVGFQIRELAAKPVGELAAAAQKLGVQTKDQLQATADNFRESFQTIASSGQFTNQQLAEGAQTFLDAYKAANDGVVDSFDPVVEKALEVIASVEQMTGKVVELGEAANGLRHAADLGNIKEMPFTELQLLLADTMKAYRNLGIMNVQDLTIVQQMQAELQRKGQENVANMREQSDRVKKIGEDQIAALKAIQGGTNTARNEGVAPKGGGTLAGSGGMVNNFNFGGGSVTPDEIRRTVIPAIRQVSRRVL